MLRLFESTIDTIITTRRARLARDPASMPRDLLTLLLEAKDPETGEALSESEIRANILTFIAAGHETTANCIAWTLYLLSQSREWRERVQAEADRELDGATDDLADRLVETRAVIDESNRLYPPITAISRAALGPDELAGHPIKRGTMVVIAPYRATSPPHVVDEARQFRSESFPRPRTRAHRSLRLSAVRRGSARVHWRDFCAAGGVDRGGDADAAFHLRS